MNSVDALNIGTQAIYVLLICSLPLLLVALVVGLTISLFQALTQIQEMTLSFVPKIIAVFFALIIFFPFMGNKLNTFSEELATRIISGF